MSRNAQLWAFICYLFKNTRPVLLQALGSAERQFVEALARARAVRLQVGVNTHTMCPYCRERSARLVRRERDAPQRFAAQCRCGVHDVDPQSLMRVALDPQWLAPQLARALDLPAEAQVLQELLPDVWQLGAAVYGIVIARSPDWLWRRPELLSSLRERTARVLRLIVPRPHWMPVMPPLPGAQWLPLQESFTFSDGRVRLIGAGGGARAVEADDGSPYHGPFSRDFRRVHLPEWLCGAISLSDGQGRIFRVLWECRGRPISGEELMRRAGLDSHKPGDLFKLKAHQRGRPEYEGALHAYRTLIQTHRREGTYWMPCALPPLSR